MRSTNETRLNEDRAPRRMFAAVIAIEVIVLVALWFIGLHFS